MATTRSVVRPSCSRKIRCPRPHRGAVRNWSPPAPPCETLSARVSPIWWISISENAGTGWLLNAATKLEDWVLPGEGLWQVAQPIELNSWDPLVSEVCGTALPFRTTPPGGGGARKRMKLEKAETSSRTAALVVWFGFTVSSG